MGARARRRSRFISGKDRSCTFGEGNIGRASEYARLYIGLYMISKRVNVEVLYVDYDKYMKE